MNPCTPSTDRFREVFNIVEPYIERRYGVPVVITDVPNPFTGDLDGAEILVDYGLEPEEAAFILVHLFGHTVQWNTSERARQIGAQAVSQPSEQLLAELAAYEREAACLSLQLFHDAGVTDLDQWLADFAACDFAYLRCLYTTGEKRPFKSFWQAGATLLTPRPIPPFQPTRWRSRADGIVV